VAVANKAKSKAAESLRLVIFALAGPYG